MKGFGLDALGDLFLSFDCTNVSVGNSTVTRPASFPYPEYSLIGSQKKEFKGSRALNKSQKVADV
jgi:hypothetical protein